MALHHISREITPLGIIVALTGVVAVVGIDGLKRILKIGDTLVEGENVVTGDEGEVTIGFADGSSVEVGRDSQLAINTEQYDPASVRGHSSEILQAIKDGINAGQSGSELLNLVARGELPGTDISDNNPGVGSQPGITNPGDTTGGDDPVIPPPDSPPPGGDTPPENTLPELTISDVIIKEPAASTDNGQGSGAGTETTAVFTVSLSEASADDVTLHFKTVDATAASTGQGGASLDYDHNAGVLTIPAGETSTTISVVINGDDIVEGTENFIVQLSHAVNATLANSQGVGVITDNEPSGQSGGSGGIGFGGADGTPGSNEPTSLDDIIHGSGGHDTISALDGDDIVFGAGGDDSIKGGAGDDLLIGGSGDDVLIGNVGDDVLMGQVGDDNLSGNAGNDILIGGRGEDLLAGGGGRDIFSFTDMSEAGDVITDFKTNQNDAIDISELLDGFSEGDDLGSYVNLVQEGNNLELHVDPAGSGDFTLLVTLQDSAAQLSTDPVDLLTEGSLIINSNTIV